MSVRSFTLAGAALVALSAALPAASVLAQPQSSTAAMAQSRAARPLPPSRIEGRIAFLQTELKITAGQSQQWQAFADLLRQQDEAKRARIEQMRAQRASAQPGVAPQLPSALERLQRRETMAEQRAADLRQLVGAFQPLYASFSDEQKQTADQLFGRFAGGERGHGKHGHHGRF